MSAFDNTFTSYNNASLFTEEDLQNNFPRTNSRLLTSTLFKGKTLLQEVADKKKLISLKRNYYHDDIITIGIALKIIIPEVVDKGNDDIKDFIPSREYTKTTYELVKLFQFWLKPEEPLFPDGIIGPLTIKALDEELNRIGYYDVNAQKAIHNEGKAKKVGRFTVVKTSTAWLYSQPIDEEVYEKRYLFYNDRVRMIDIMSNGWCYVEIDDVTSRTDEEKIFGYVKTSAIWTESEIPEPNAELHTINSSETTIGILAKNVFNLPSDIDDDDDGKTLLRYYANVLIYINNPEGKIQKIRKSLNPLTGNFELNETNPLVNAALYIRTDTGEDEDTFGNSTWWQVIKNFASLSTPMADLVIPLIQRSWENWEELMNEQNRGWELFSKTVPVNGSNIWVPSRAFADSLKAAIDVAALSYMPGPTIVEKMQKAASDFFSSTNAKIKETIDENWPVGWGVMVDRGIGATFAIPIGVDKENYTYLARVSEKEFKLVRRGVIKAGLDAEVGVGAYLGSGKPFKKDYDTGYGKYKVGVTAGAELEKKVKYTLHQEFVFPLDKDWALINMFYATFERDQNSSILPVFNPTMFASAFLKNFVGFNLDPNDYLKVNKIEFGGYETITGGASIGVKMSEPDSESYWAGKKNRNTLAKAKSFTIQSLISWLSAELLLERGVEIAVGIEIKYTSDISYDLITGFKIPSQCEVSLYCEGALISNLNAKTGVPFLPSWTFDLGFAGGAKFTWIFNYNPGHFDGTVDPLDRFISANKAFTFKSVSLYMKDGDTDIYDGKPAYQYELELGSSITSVSNVQSLINAINGISIEKRIYVGKAFTKEYNKLQRFYKRLPRLLTESKIEAGLEFDGYFTLKVNVKRENVVALLENLINDIISPEGGNQSLEDAILYIKDYLFNRTHPFTNKKVPKYVVLLLDSFEVEKSILFFSAGLGIGMGLKLGMGGKVRLSVNGRVAFTIERNLGLADIQEFFEAGSATHILKWIIWGPDSISNVSAIAPGPKDN